MNEYVNKVLCQEEYWTREWHWWKREGHAITDSAVACIYRWECGDM